MKFSLALFGLVALSACMELDPGTVARQSTADICYSMAVARAGNGSPDTIQVGMDELKARGAFTAAELAQISAGHVRVGMTEGAALCVWGVNGITNDGINTTVVAGHIHKQFVVGRGNYYPPKYLYTDNGVVSGIQE